MAHPRFSLLTVVLAGIAVYQWQARRCEAEQRKLGTSQAKPHEVSTWEGEGGALKGTGAQLGPDSATP